MEDQETRLIRRRLWAYLFDLSPALAVALQFVYTGATKVRRQSATPLSDPKTEPAILEIFASMDSDLGLLWDPNLVNFLRNPYSDEGRKSMAVVIESSVWEPNPWIFVFITVACLLSIIVCPYASKNYNSTTKIANVFDHGISSTSFLRFQRNFLLIYSLASGLYVCISSYSLVSSIIYGCGENVGSKGVKQIIQLRM